MSAAVSWSVDGQSVSSEATLDGAVWFDRGQLVEVSTEHDGVIGSAAVTVENTPPRDPTLSLTEDADGDLVCEVVSATDADDDAIELNFTWTVDGVTFADSSNHRHTGDAIEAVQLARGSEWTCTVSVSDDEPGGSAEVSWLTEGPAYGGYWFSPILLIERPADMLALPDGRLLIARLSGELLLVDPVTGTVVDEVILWDEEADELTGIVLDPQFGDGVNDYIYGWFSRDAHLMRWELTLEPLHALGGVDLMTFEKYQFSGHSGGDLLWWDGESDEPVLYLALEPQHRRSDHRAGAAGRQRADVGHGERHHASGGHLGGGRRRHPRCEGVDPGA